MRAFIQSDDEGEEFCSFSTHSSRAPKRLNSIYDFIYSSNIPLFGVNIDGHIQKQIEEKTQSCTFSPGIISSKKRKTFYDSSSDDGDDIKIPLSPKEVPVDTTTPELNEFDIAKTPSIDKRSSSLTLGDLMSSNSDFIRDGTTTQKRESSQIGNALRVNSAHFSEEDDWMDNVEVKSIATNSPDEQSREKVKRHKGRREKTSGIGNISDMGLKEESETKNWSPGRKMSQRKPSLTSLKMWIEGEGEENEEQLLSIQPEEDEGCGEECRPSLQVPPLRPPEALLLIGSAKRQRLARQKEEEGTDHPHASAEEPGTTQRTVNQYAAQYLKEYQVCYFTSLFALPL
jgi:hypothetical protein